MLGRAPDEVVRPKYRWSTKYGHTGLPLTMVVRPASPRELHSGAREWPRASQLDHSRKCPAQWSNSGSNRMAGSEALLALLPADLVSAPLGQIGTPRHSRARPVISPMRAGADSTPNCAMSKSSKTSGASSMRAMEPVNGPACAPPACADAPRVIEPRDTTLLSPRAPSCRWPGCSPIVCRRCGGTHRPAPTARPSARWLRCSTKVLRRQTDARGTVT